MTSVLPALASAGLFGATTVAVQRGSIAAGAMLVVAGGVLIGRLG